MSIEATQESFPREVRSAADPVVLEFYATWCGNCRRIAPTLEALHEEFSPGMRLVKVNADESPDLVREFGVTSTPTLFVLAPGGARLTSAVGAQPPAVLRSLFEAAASRTGAQERRGPVAVVPASWVPAEACTLPTAQQPARVAEFGDLFDAGLLDVQRATPGWLRLRFADDADLAASARDLIAREAQCCTFFDFSLTSDVGGLLLDIRVPQDKTAVLEGLDQQAQASLVARA